MLQTTPNSAIPAAVFARKRRPTVDALASMLDGQDDDLSDVDAHAAGVIFVDPEGRVLVLKRSPDEKNYGGHWCWPGGKADDGETPEETAAREAGEETGGAAPDGPRHLLSSVRTPNNFAFHTFVQPVGQAFIPRLMDGEHVDYAWADPDELPQPMHPGVVSALETLANDAEFNEADHPRAPDGKFGSGGGGGSKPKQQSLPAGLSIKAAKSTEMRPAHAGERPADPNAHEVQIVDKAGKPQYRIEVTEEKNSKLPDGTTLWGVGYIENLTREHHGLAPAIYQEAAKLAEKNGGILVGGMTTNAYSRKVLNGMIANGQAEEIDYKGRKLVRILAPGESSGDGSGIGAKRSLADKLVAHGETIRAHGRAAQDFVRGKSAGEVLAQVAGNEKLREHAKDGLSVAIQSLLSHSAGLDASTWKLTEDLVDHTVHHFADIASITAAQAKDVMRKGVQALIASRKAGKTADAQDEEDGVLAALEALLDVLSDDEITATDSALKLAFDRDTLREKDRDGRMRVAISNISRACVNPYRGAEIPGWDETTQTHALGLDPDKIYMLLRDPDELSRAASTFNGIQLLKEHNPVTADEPRQWDVVGTTGTDATFDGEYLKNSLIIWTQTGIDFVESGEQRELSCGYHYVPDMTPGEFKGQRYDGVMRNIVGNHVALVRTGRAGPDVVVCDSAEALQWAAIEEALLGW